MSPSVCRALNKVKRVNLLQNKQTFESYFHCTMVPQVKEKHLNILSILMTPIKSLVPWNVHVSHVHLNNGTFQKISETPPPPKPYGGWPGFCHLGHQIFFKEFWPPRMKSSKVPSAKNGGGGGGDLTFHGRGGGGCRQ